MPVETIEAPDPESLMEVEPPCRFGKRLAA
jgi:hypothetical protein